MFASFWHWPVVSYDDATICTDVLRLIKRNFDMYDCLSMKRHHSSKLLSPTTGEVDIWISGHQVQKCVDIYQKIAANFPPLSLFMREKIWLFPGGSLISIDDCESVTYLPIIKIRVASINIQTKNAKTLLFRPIPKTPQYCI